MQIHLYLTTDCAINWAKVAWVMSYNPIIFNYLEANSNYNWLMYLHFVDTCHTSTRTSIGNLNVYTCNGPGNLCSDLLPCPNLYALFNLVMGSWTTQLTSLSLCCCARFVRKIEKKVEASFTFFATQKRVSGNWKMFISRLLSHLRNMLVDARWSVCVWVIGKATAYANCVIYPLQRPWHQV